MAIRVAIGISDFRRVRNEGLYYVDKSLLIRDVLDHPAEVLLFPRPRRFGKTLNLSMLRTFLEKSSQEVATLFAGLRIFEPEGGDARAHFQRYPVISLSFKDVKAVRFDDCFQGIAGVLQGAYQDHLYLLKEGKLEPHEEEAFRDILHARAAPARCWRALRELSRLLSRYHNERVLILIDDYDTPIQAGFTYSYEDEVTLFFRNLFSAALEDNPYLYKAVLTGVLRVASESLLSGLSNVAAYSILQEEFAASFGFTEPEVELLLHQAGLIQAIEDVRSWYNGHDFGWQPLYNPWSVLCYAHRPEAGCKAYWNFVSSEDVLRALLIERGPEVFGELRHLLTGGAIQKRISDAIVLRELRGSASALWNLLLFSGYLTFEKLHTEDGRSFADLRIPNREVRMLFEDDFLHWAGAQPQEPRRRTRKKNDT